MTQTSITMPAAPGPSIIPQPTSPPPRPDYIPEKFWDGAKGQPKVDELAKAYVNLEKHLGSSAKPAAQPASQPQTPEQPAPEQTPASQVPAGLDIAALTNEFSTNGSLSEQTIKALEAKGIPKPLVDSYIRGIQAQADVTLQGIFSSPQEIATFKEQAAKVLSAEERAAFNTIVQTGDQNAVRVALMGLKAKVAESSPQDPSLIGGESPSSTGSVGFPTWAHVTAAMNDPRYHKDPAYRDEVQRRLRVSNFN